MIKTEAEMSKDMIENALRCGRVVRLRDGRLCDILDVQKLDTEQIAELKADRKVAPWWDGSYIVPGDSPAITDRGPKRSTPGKGDPVAVFVLHPNNPDPSFYGSPNGPLVLIPTRLQEDFAVCAWPIIVKVKPTVTGAQIRSALLTLAEQYDATDDETLGSKMATEEDNIPV